ncbi:DEAD/DEAH box helicase [Sinimarinibacterium sp. CAU 1509]|nr:DEAD/DEAH box helicase [Sinimarinibacterium sp. CAU 1509]
MATNAARKRVASIAGAALAAEHGRARPPAPGDLPEVLIEGLPPIRLRPLLLPLAFEDLTTPVTSFAPRAIQHAVDTLAATAPNDPRLHLGGRHCVLAVKVTKLESFGLPGASQGVRGLLCDRRGLALAFETNEPAPALERYFAARAGRTLGLLGSLRKQAGRWVLFNPEPVASRWVGRVRPIYPIHSKTIEAQLARVEDIAPESYLAQGRVQNVYSANVAARERSTLTQGVAMILQDGLKCKQSLRAALGADAAKPKAALEELLRRMHAPADLQQAFEASERIDLIGAVASLSEGIEAAYKEDRRIRRLKRKPRACEAHARENDYRDYVDELALTLPFALTGDQRRANRECLHSIDAGRPMRRLLLGDVGSGKTAVYAMVARAMLRAGGRVAILIPNSNLALQVHRHLLSWIPESPAEFVSGKAQPESSDAPLVVGTTSISAQCGAVFDLVIVDEQHRFSRNQREAQMAARAHLLEVTATPIPRTQALAQLGVLQVSTLHGCPVEKRIITRVWLEEDKSQLFAEVARTVKGGRQVLVIYPAKHHPAASEDDDAPVDAEEQAEADSAERPDQDILYSVCQFYDTWEKAFPGRVRMAHGGQLPEQNQQALHDMAAGEADILISTTIVEVGVDLPGLARAVVVQAQRFGASTLHQIRGRVARAGGLGYCDLYAPGAVRPKSLERLQVLVDCSDGFEIARRDLAIRGGGDATIFGHRQKGKRANVLFRHRTISDTVQQEASERLQLEWFGQRGFDD